MLPITAKLMPTSVRNLSYMLQIAFLTRLTLGLARIWQNRPSNQKEKSLSLTEKKVNMGERAFVETVGTLAAVLPLHLMQDVVSKIYESRLHIPQLSSRDLPDLAGDQLEKVNNAILDVFGKDGKANSSGIIKRLLYGFEKGGETVKSNLGTLREKIVTGLGIEENVFRKSIYPRLKPFAKNNNRAAAVAIGLGILAGALCSGPLIQRLNDYWVSPKLARRFRAQEKGMASSEPPSAPKQPPVPTKPWTSESPVSTTEPAALLSPAFSALSMPAAVNNAASPSGLTALPRFTPDFHQPPFVSPALQAMRMPFAMPWPPAARILPPYGGLMR